MGTCLAAAFGYVATVRATSAAIFGTFMAQAVENKLKGHERKNDAEHSESKRKLPMSDLKTATQSITQITVIETEPGKQKEVLTVMKERANFMARQPGFISINLYRGLDERRIVNHVRWESRELLHAAHKSPEFRKEWRRFDALTDEIVPHLYELAEGISNEQK
jgi:heme-degrading monooxygenase HmoA